MNKLIDLSSYPVKSTLRILLQDKTTKKNIIWATDTYKDLGAGYEDTDQITAKNICGISEGIIQPRVLKSLEAQKERTRVKAEVMTPSWLCNRMNNFCDEEWFGRKDVFNTENEDNTWSVVEDPIEFPEGKKWQQYIDSRRLEITCGEAPFLASRYDTVTGNIIVPPKLRIGILDRKMRIVGENIADYDTWLKWTYRAFQASYGYEYQGDNLLIARINLLMSFVDYYEAKWGKEPDAKTLRIVANIISWNIWQMDGLKGTTPLGAPYEEYHQMSLFEMTGGEDEDLTSKAESIPCLIRNWRAGSTIRYMNVGGKNE